MKDEAEQTVRKTENNKYYDISKDVATRKGITNLSEEEFQNLMGKLRLRFSLTPACNIWCMFCSNEGLSYGAKKNKPSNIDLITKFSDIVIEKTSLKSIDFSGGEPTIHPDFINKEYKLIEWTKKHPNIRFSIHTNGIKLTPEIIDKIAPTFSRIGLSINSVNYETWSRISDHTTNINADTKKRYFTQIMQNIDYIHSKKISEKVFLKMVVMKGINDSKKELSDFLDFSAKYNFHPKFLQFEPQYESQKIYEITREELFTNLKNLGCTFDESIPLKEDSKCYFPNVNFNYEKKPGARMGLHSTFGCGLEGACLACYDYLCIFVKPSDDGKGLYLKPCSVLDTRIDLTHAINTNDANQVLNLLKMSREYLMLAPGIGSIGWNKEKQYDFGGK